MDAAYVPDKKKISQPAYRIIAMDIAKEIVAGKYAEGQKLFGRSVLASHYQVSPETVRKAVSILKDVGVVETEKGSGIEIISTAKAKEFLNHYNELDSILSMKKDIVSWANRQAKESFDMVEKINHLVSSTVRIKMESPLKPYAFKILPDSNVIGKTVDELRFWHNTGATIIAIERGEELIISPGPYATFRAGDIFFFIGADHSYASVQRVILE